MTPSPDSVVFSLAQEYLQAREAGRMPDRADLLARNPELAPALARVLDALDCVGNISTPTGPCAGSEMGEFRIVAEIGRGGMGIVYEADQPALGRRVAIKVLPFAVALDAVQRKRFDNEARAAAGLEHPHIVPVHAVGEARGVPYFAMRLIDGRPMSAWLREEAFPWQPGNRPEAVATVGRQAAEALAHAHSQGVLHRDIKPANVMVEPTGHAWVVDFGLARVEGADSLTASGALAGTPRYLSPEQAAGRPLDHRTDQYSLAITLYEALVRRPAVTGESREEVLLGVLQSEPKSPRAIDRNIPRPLEAVLLTAMAREPANRYPSCQDFADDLGRFLSGEPVRAKLPGVGTKLSAWAWRRRVVLGTAVGALVAGLAVAVGVLLLKNEEVREAEVFARGEQGKAEDALKAEQQALRAEQEALKAEQQALKAERRTRYQQGIGLAWREWLAGNAARARQLHGECPQEWRDWEWHYLKRVFAPELAVWPNVPLAGAASYFSPEGNVVAIPRVGKVALHDARTGRLLREVRQKPKEAFLAVGARGESLLFGTSKLVFEKGTIVPLPGTTTMLHLVSAYSLDLASGRKAPVFEGKSIPRDRVFLQGKRLVLFGARTLVVPEAGPNLPALEAKSVRAVVPRADPNLLLILGDSGTVSSFDLTNGKSRSLFGAEPRSLAFALSPDEKTAVVADSEYRLWKWSLDGPKRHPTPIDLRARLGIWKSSRRGMRLELAFLDGGRVLVHLDGPRREPVVLDLEGNGLHALTGSPNPPSVIAISPDRSRLLTFGNPAEARLWDVAPPQLLRPGIPIAKLRLAFDASGALTFHDDRPFTGLIRLVIDPKAAPAEAKRLPLGTRKAGRESLVWERAKSQIVAEREGKIVGSRQARNVLAAELSPAGDLVAVRFMDAVELWWADGLRTAHRLEGCQGSGPVAFCADGRRLVVSREPPQGSELAVFDTASGRDLLALPLPGMASTMAFSADGRLAVALLDGTVRVLDGTAAK